MWVPIHDEEWDGDIPLGLTRTSSTQIDAENGTVVFKGNTLPWLVGKYEVRILCRSSPTLSYFCDFRSAIIMTANIMSWAWMVLWKFMVILLLNLLCRLLNYWFSVIKPSEPLAFTSVRESLMRVVPLCLDSDPSLIPLSCKLPTFGDADPEDTSDLQSELPRGEGDSDQTDRDPDDFSFWTEKQAKRICTAIKQIFDVEYAPEVVLADANLTVLANRILVSKEILSSTSSDSTVRSTWAHTSCPSPCVHFFTSAYSFTLDVYNDPLFIPTREFMTMTI